MGGPPSLACRDEAAQLSASVTEEAGGQAQGKGDSEADKGEGTLVSFARLERYSMSVI